MVELLFLAVALAMDAFAVSIGLGTKYPLSMFRVAALSAVYFGVFQGLMPLLGYLFGKSVLGVLAGYAPWIACVILLTLGGKMLYEAWQYDKEDDTTSDDLIPKSSSKVGDMEVTSSHFSYSQADFSFASKHQNKHQKHITHQSMFTLAVATSIDAMAAGFTLNLMPVNALISCALIAVVTAGFSFFGVFLGKKSGTWLESRAEIFGGLVLMLIGIKMVIW